MRHFPIPARRYGQARLLWLSFFISLSYAMPLYAQQSPVVINEIRVTPVAALPALPANGPYSLIACFPQPLDNAHRQRLAQSGISVGEYMGENRYLLLFRQGSDRSALSGATGYIPVRPDFKINTSVREQSGSGKPLKLLVSFYPGISREQALEVITAAGGAMETGTWQQEGLYQLSLPAAGLKQLASFYGLRYISPASECSNLDLDSKRGQGAIPLNMPIALGGKGLTAKNVVIGHGDQSSGIYHIDMADRIVNYNPYKMADHGVLVNGIIGGDGIMDPAGQGIATDALFLSHYFDAIIGAKSEMYWHHGMTLTNNSYATMVGNCTYAGTYDNISRVLDSQALKMPDVLDVFAAGNDGRNGCRGYPLGYANVCGGFQTAKNILVVGATYRDYVIGEGSSRGPIKDGRLKPEIVAGGIDILCPLPGEGYTITRGTSLSCPQVTGGVALISERYRQLYSGANPRSDLLKALMINGASDLGRPGPDFWYGFGFMNLTRSLAMLEQTRFTRNTLAAGGADQSFTIDVPPNTGQVKVLLYYHDAVASAASSTQLVNDLDLSVTEPGGSIRHLPLILDPSIAGVGNIAAEGIDRLNNAEQVTINNPPAGMHTITVSGFNIPEGPQEYVVAYDLIPKGLKLLFPVANASAPADTAMYLYWEATPDATHSFQLDYSTDDGASWQPMATVAADTRVYRWRVPAINSAYCKVRVSRDGFTDESGAFVINNQPAIRLSEQQCPGSFAIDWTAVPGATKYYVLLKKGPHFVKADSVAAGTLRYTFPGLRLHERYYAAVQPLIDNKDGYRSMGISRIPDTGSCAAVAHGDLSAEALIAPADGRRYTSSALELHTPVTVRVRNRDNIAVSNYSIAYRVNGGSWVTYPVFSIGPNTTTDNLIEYFDFSTPGDYTISIAVHNNDRSDPVSSNDTITRLIRHFPNDQLDLSSAKTFDFEELPDFALQHDTTGLGNGHHWDYNNSTDTGRLRSSIPGSPLLSSSRSISMDVGIADQRTVNYFSGNFNLSRYDTLADEIRFDFEYEMRGMPALKDSNKVWARGSDRDPWLPVFTYSNTFTPDALHHSGTLSLRDLFLAAGQNFSASTQIRFGQFDSTLISDDNYGGGLSIDNIHLYKISKDITLSAIEAPFSSNCDLSSSPVRIRIRNGTTQVASGIRAYYQLDGLPVVSESLPGTLAGKDSITFSFSSGLSGLTPGAHNLNVWISMAGDDYLRNDSINNYSFVISPLIDSFPYLEDFEHGEGYWYSSGSNSSWGFGTPAAVKIKNAASGQNAWKTGLSGVYNSREFSYLTSPCINTSLLAEPMLSFSTAMDIEYCDGTICDAAYMEYSTDNERSWSRLGTAGTGTNWYNNGAAQVWNLADQTRWHVASVSLPQSAALKLRFVFRSDAGANLEGIALDDMHIFDRKPIELLITDTTATATAVPGPRPVPLITPGNTSLGSFAPATGASGAAQLNAYRQSSTSDPAGRQYLVPRSLQLQHYSSSTSGHTITLYISEAEANRYLADTSCRLCSRAEDIYRTGVTYYSSPSGTTEDGYLDNDTDGRFSYYPWAAVRWVPYDQGYGAVVPAGNGEYWFNNGGLTGTLPANTRLIDFELARKDEQSVVLHWRSQADTAMTSYTLERSSDSINFSPLTVVPALKTATPDYSYEDKPGAGPGSRTYYRVKGTLRNAAEFWSVIRYSDQTGKDELLDVYPVPTTDGQLKIHWIAAPGQRAQVQCSDINGRKVLLTELTAAAWDNTSILQLRQLARGMYWLRITLGTTTYTRKILLQ